jgi:hypothetical protein
MVAFGLQAQINYSFFFAKNGAKKYYSKSENINTYKSFKQAKIKSVTQTYSKKEKIKFNITHRYNPSTFIFQIESWDYKSKNHNTYINYNNDTQIVSSYFINNKKDTSYFETFAYDENGDCEKLYTYDSKKKLHNLTLYEWLAYGKMKTETYSDSETQKIQILEQSMNIMMMAK